MKLLLSFLLMLPILKISAQEPEHPQDTVDGKNELIIISSEKNTPADTSELIIIQDRHASDKKGMPIDNSIVKNHMISITGKKYAQSIYAMNRQYPSFEGHWSGFYYGFVNFGNTDYSLYHGKEYHEYGDFMSLDWAHSFAMQFNFFKHSINLVKRNNFGIVWGLGLEYQRLRFENNYTSVTRGEHRLEPVDLHAYPEMASIKRSCFKTLYLTVPVMLELQLPAEYKERFYISGGVMGGVRLHSKTKIVYRDANDKKHKQKEKDNLHMIPFKADLVGKIGYQNVCLWGSYTLTNLFKADKGPELHAYTIGIGINF